MVDIPVNFLEALSAISRCKGVAGQLLFGTIYCSPSSNEINDSKLYDLLFHVQNNFIMPKLIVGNFNYTNIESHYSSNGGASAWCGRLSANDTKFINAIRENLLYQHVVEPTRQRGSDSRHTLDLVLMSDDFFYLTLNT